MCVCCLCSALPGEMMTEPLPSALCVGLPVCWHVYVSPAELTCFHWFCVCVCVSDSPFTSDVSFWMTACVSRDAAVWWWGGSLCINSSVKPLLKTDDCSVNFYKSVHSLKLIVCNCHDGNSRIIKKRRYFYTSSASALFQLFSLRQLRSSRGRGQ